MAARSPIYDEPAPPVHLQPVPPPALAVEIGKLRQLLSSRLGDAESSSRQAVDGVLRVERSFEARIRSLRAADEALTPNAYYVLVAGFAGSILATRRNLLVRLALPTISLIGASAWLLPKTTSNVANYLSQVEHERLPAFARAQDDAFRSLRQTYDSVVGQLRGLQRTSSDALSRSAQKIEEASGLKVASVVKRKDE